MEKKGDQNNNNVILDIKSLSVSFSTSRGSVQAVRNLDLSLNRGETLAIVGESGSGKTVTVKTLIGILSKNGVVNSGTALFHYTQDGKDVTVDLLGISKKQKRDEINGKRISIIFQDPMTSLNPTIPIGKQIMESLLLHKTKNKKEAHVKTLELLEMVGFEEPERQAKNYPHQLSGGMRQRVVIAIALACGPDILICDEPTTALDVTIQEKILHLIQDIQIKTGVSVIYITHDMGVVAKVADYVAVMYAGRIVEKGRADEIFYHSRHPYTWGLLLAMPDLYTSGETLYTIPGNPPDLLHIPKGDPFAARNKRALHIDTKREPPLFQISPTHYAATWLLHEKAPELAMPAELKRRISRMLKEAEKGD
jgi:oligopeptide transport system ATP-binding protein